MGDPKITQDIEGLNPNPIRHKTYVNVNPKLGFAMSGYTRLQLNIQVRKSLGFNQLDMFDKNLMLPIAWFEIVSYQTKEFLFFFVSNFTRLTFLMPPN